MNNNYLVYPIRSFGEFKKGNVYRSIPFDNEGILINGEMFSYDEFYLKFKYVLTRAKEHFDKLGLLEYGKAIQKEKFFYLEILTEMIITVLSFLLKKKQNLFHMTFIVNIRMIAEWNC